VTWRYQPVWIGEPNDRAVTLCEVYLDSEDKLEAWTARPSMHPQGETVDELIADLRHMLDDARKWQPITFVCLRVGMTFERTDNEAVKEMGW